MPTIKIGSDDEPCCTPETEVKSEENIEKKDESCCGDKHCCSKFKPVLIALGILGLIYIVYKLFKKKD